MRIRMTGDDTYARAEAIINAGVDCECNDMDVLLIVATKCPDAVFFRAGDDSREFTAKRILSGLRGNFEVREEAIPHSLTPIPTNEEYYKGEQP